MIYGLVGAALMLLWLFCIIDVIMTPDAECRHLPKLLWLGIVVLLGTIGSVAWLLVGRPWPNGSPIERLGGGRAGGEGAYARQAPGFPEYDRPGRFAATSPDDDEEFLATVRERAEAQRRAEAARRRERERAEIAERERRQESRRAEGEPDGT